MILNQIEILIILIIILAIVIGIPLFSIIFCKRINTDTESLLTKDNSFV
jgi:hypothetical protein